MATRLRNRGPHQWLEFRDSVEHLLLKDRNQSGATVGPRRRQHKRIHGTSASEALCTDTVDKIDSSG
jgi:hypothetical protein